MVGGQIPVQESPQSLLWFPGDSGGRSAMFSDSSGNLK